MAKDKKLSTSGMSTKERMLARKKDLESRGSGSGFIFPKEGELRIRIKSPGEDQELGMELIQFYLGKDVGAIISPATFNEPCPFMEKYQELKNSSDPSDKELAKDKFIPRRKYVIGGIIFKDNKGKEVDYEGKDRMIMIPRSVYQDIIDLYLDEDEAGDMTDPDNGYDIKIIRSGSGLTDTNYSTRACKNTSLDKRYRGTVELEDMVRTQIKSYDELEDILAKYLNEDIGDNEDDNYGEKEEEKPKKKKILRKKKVSDI